ncbi:MAG: hypothetical protein OHK005_03270 [Candidatus Methylacidiphilales bacterium]
MTGCPDARAAATQARPHSPPAPKITTFICHPPTTFAPQAFLFYGPSRLHKSISSQKQTMASAGLPSFFNQASFPP